MRKTILAGVGLCLLTLASPAADKKAKLPQVKATPVDAYIQDAAVHATNFGGLGATPGSTWQPGGIYGDLTRDLRANQVDDMVTIVVSESASAVSTGSTKSSRASSAQHSVTSLFRPVNAGGALANLLGTTGNQSLQGDGATSRSTTLSATISARVTNVLPNGYLALEGIKRIVVNSENQTVTVRGVARAADIATDNTVPSSKLAQLDVRIDGKGVVNDAIRRPFFLYRLLLGLLPF
jgi:flagellar L-ring protein precursor FlgH